MIPEPDAWHEWLGRSERRVDRVCAAPLAALAATLDRDDPEPVHASEVPPLWHWLYFKPLARQSELGPDGHARRGRGTGGRKPPRRMWAGGRFAFEHPLHVGDEIVRTSRIADIRAKQGRSGALVFVTLRHEIADARGVAITEEHDIVYRGDARPENARPAPQAPADERFAREIAPDPVLLFRYSALTFNGHRIHYDRGYVTEVEGYPGLIVHGPLIATLLLDLLRREYPRARVRRFAFKAVSPLFDTDRFAVCGRPEGGNAFMLWARSHDGALAMQASAEVD